MGGKPSKKLVPNRPLPRPLVPVPNRNPPKEPIKMVPPDGGWGWMVVLGACLSFIFFPAVTVAFGVMFKDRLEGMGASATSYTLIGNALSTVWSFTALFVVPLTELFGHRKVTIMGGAMAFLTMLLSAYSTSLVAFGLSYSLIGGMAGSLSTFNGFTIIPLYFSKRKGMASGIVAASSALGKIAMAPLVRLLLDTYGYTWSCLLVGAMSLHTCITGMLYQPPKWHQVPEKDSDSEILDISVNGVPSAVEGGGGAEGRGGGGEGGSAEGEKRSPITNRQKYERLRSKTSGDEEADDDIIFSIEGATSHTPLPKGEDDEVILFARGERQPKKRPRSVVERSVSIESAAISWHGSLDMLPPLENKVFEDDDEEGTDGREKTCCDDFIVVKVFKMLHYSLIKEPNFHLIAWPNSIIIMAYLNCMYALPGYVTSIGFDHYQAAFAISVFSVTEVICRLGFAVLSDFQWFPIEKAYICGTVLSGVSMTAMTFVASYEWILVWVAVNGVALSLTSVLLIHLVVRYLGQENYAHAIGFFSILNGILLIIGGFLVGVTRDFFGSYFSVFYILTTFISIAACIWILWVGCFFAKSKSTSVGMKVAA